MDRNTPISPAENLRLLLSGKQPLWMPTASAYVTLAPKVVPDNVARGYVIDADPLDLELAGGKDWFGVEWVYIPTSHGSMVRPGTPKVQDITEWESYITFPDLDLMDWAASAEKNKALQSPEKLTLVWVMNGLFERLISFLDFENAALAMVDEDEQDSVHRLFDALCNFYDKLFEKIKTHYNADIILFHDDWGSQRAPFFSLSTAREMLVPYLTRVVQSAHSRGMFFEFHSCGKNELLVPAMIEAGIDVWTPQEMNDTKKLIQTYGDNLIFGIRPKLPEADATDEEIRTMAYYFVEEYGKNRKVISSGWAFEPHQIKFFEYVKEASRIAYSN